MKPLIKQFQKKLQSYYNCSHEEHLKLFYKNSNQEQDTARELAEANLKWKDKERQIV